jgi:hypothetical protein
VHCKSQLSGPKARTTGDATSANKIKFLIIAAILDKKVDCDSSWYSLVLSQEHNKEVDFMLRQDCIVIVEQKDFVPYYWKTKNDRQKHTRFGHSRPKFT